MLPPKPRLLTVMEVVDPQSQATPSTRTNTRYPNRRSFERAVQSFIIYLVVASRFADSPDTRPEDDSSPQAQSA